ALHLEAAREGLTGAHGQFGLLVVIWDGRHVPGPLRVRHDEAGATQDSDKAAGLVDQGEALRPRSVRNAAASFTVTSWLIDTEFGVMRSAAVAAERMRGPRACVSCGPCIEVLLSELTGPGGAGPGPAWTRPVRACPSCCTRTDREER